MRNDHPIMPQRLPTKEASKNHLRPTQNLAALEGSVLREPVTSVAERTKKGGEQMKECVLADLHEGCKPKGAARGGDGIRSNLEFGRRRDVANLQ